MSAENAAACTVAHLVYRCVSTIDACSLPIGTRALRILQMTELLRAGQMAGLTDHRPDTRCVVGIALIQSPQVPPPRLTCQERLYAFTSYWPGAFPCTMTFRSRWLLRPIRTSHCAGRLCTDLRPWLIVASFPRFATTGASPTTDKPSGYRKPMKHYQVSPSEALHAKKPQSPFALRSEPCRSAFGFAGCGGEG
ncbi:hypothetical protein LZ30DRAFT_149233 [Colletotrichum cereale]|nr:hypothetical protein LZ30DRAFT_149233 [Colletotrichum cereale]